MSRKNLVPVLAALGLTALAVLLVSTRAWAKSPSPLAQAPRPLARFRAAGPVLGTLTSVGSDQFTITKRDGAELNFKVDQNTRYRDREQQTGITFADLQVGDWVAVSPSRAAGEASLARLVVVLPEDFTGSAQHTYAGAIQAVNVQAGTFQLKTPRLDQVLTFSVDQDTRFRSGGSAIAGLQDLKTGMSAIVFSNDLAGETGGQPLAASVVAAGEQRALQNLSKLGGRFNGQVTAVGDGEFTLQDRLGETVTFQIDSSTLFLNGLRSRATAADLKVGTRLVVTATGSGSGVYQAQIVVISPLQ